jgi:uncharacterized protein YjbI with pentapeptide repeats
MINKIKLTKFNIEDYNETIIEDSECKTKEELVKKAIENNISLERVILPSVNLLGIDFKKTNLKNAYLNGSDIRDADLSEASIKGISLLRCFIGNTTINKNQVNYVLKALGFVIK